MLAKAPRVVRGAEELSLADARKRSKYDLPLPDAALAASDNVVQRVLPFPTDSGEGFTIHYKKYAIQVTPTNRKYDFDLALGATILEDLADPESSVHQYEPAKIGSYDGIAAKAGPQMNGDTVVANAPAILRWQMPRLDGNDAEFTTVSIHGWDMNDKRMLNIAESVAEKLAKSLAD
jgi:hypothetical protein